MQIFNRNPLIIVDIAGRELVKKIRTLVADPLICARQDPTGLFSSGRPPRFADKGALVMAKQGKGILKIAGIGGYCPIGIDGERFDAHIYPDALIGKCGGLRLHVLTGKGNEPFSSWPPRQYDGLDATLNGAGESEFDAAKVADCEDVPVELPSGPPKNDRVEFINRLESWETGSLVGLNPAEERLKRAVKPLQRFFGRLGCNANEIWLRAKRGQLVDLVVKRYRPSALSISENSLFERGIVELAQGTQPPFGMGLGFVIEVCAIFE